MNRSSFKRWSFSRSASTNLENSNSAVPCGSSLMARNVFPTTLLGMVEVPFCLAYFHTAPGKYNVGSSTRPTPRARLRAPDVQECLRGGRAQRVETHFAAQARPPAPARDLGAVRPTPPF